MCGTIEVGELLVGEWLLCAGSWTHLFDDIKYYPGEMESTVVKAGPFEPATDGRLGQGIHELLDTLDENWGD